jgi:hypothetical protein
MKHISLNLFLQILSTTFINDQNMKFFFQHRRARNKEV